MMPNSVRKLPPRTSRLRPKLWALVSGLWSAVVACDDPFANHATFTNADQRFAIAALTGSDVTAPAGLSLIGQTTVRIDGAFAFDLAFDIMPDGKPKIFPAGLVGTPLTGAVQIGLIRAFGGYDAVTEAPRSGYFFDSTMVFNVGTAIAIQSQSSNCQFSLTPFTFAKVTIDSINSTTRTLYGRALINANCGFRQLTPGLPTF